MYFDRRHKIQFKINKIIKLEKCSVFIRFVVSSKDYLTLNYKTFVANQNNNLSQSEMKY